MERITDGKRGGGSIFKPSNSRFWQCSYYQSGREVRCTTGIEYLETGDPKKRERNRKEALKVLREKVGAVQAEKHGAPAPMTPAQRRVTIKELLDGLKLNYESRHKWNKKVNCLVKPLVAYFGHVQASDLTKESVTRYMVKLQADGYRDSTINRRVQLLLQSFTIADRVPPKVKRLSEIGNERKGFFERADFLKVLMHLPEYLQDFCQFAFLTGWRKGAIAKLEWTDVENDKVILRALNSKNRKPYSVPLVGEIAEIIERRRKDTRTGCPYVFHYTRKAKTRRIGDFRKCWANGCTAAGVNARLFHDFRRTAARNMVAAGVPQSTAQQITGHATASMFQRYNICSETQKQEALETVAAYHRAQDAKQPALTATIQ